jgi:hypothetical protein
MRHTQQLLALEASLPPHIHLHTSTNSGLRSPPLTITTTSSSPPRHPSAPYPSPGQKRPLLAHPPPTPCPRLASPGSTSWPFRPCCRVVSTVKLSTSIAAIFEPGSWAQVIEGKHLLPVIIPPISLHQLAVEVDKVAQEQQVVLGRHGHRVAHEGAAVEGQGGCERTRDAILICPR